MDNDEFASNAENLLGGVKRLLLATEPLYRYSREDTSALREEILNMQHDIELIQLLFPGLAVSEDGNVLAAAGAFNSVLVASVPAIRIVIESVAPLIQRLGTENVALRPTTILRISEKQSIIAETRASLAHAFSVLWLSCWVLAKDTTNTPPEWLPNQKTQLISLLDAFKRIPFAVGATDDAFIRSAPLMPEECLPLDQWQYIIERTSKSWLTSRASGRAVADVLKIHRMFLNLLWNGCLGSLRSVNLGMFREREPSLVQELVQSINTLRDGARDAILRSSSPTWSIVFVGTQGSGKSTLINAFVGVDLLPSSDGPTTSYPCLLRHRPGQKDPSLQIGTAYLNQCLEELRRGDWVPKVEALTSGQWRSDIELPDGFTLQEFKTNWVEYLPYETLETLRELMKPSFQFTPAVTGVNNIRATLNNLNVFVRICRNLPVGFDRFEPSDWPIITAEFPRLLEEPLPEGLVLVDIPGVAGSHQTSVWDEFTREIIRSAAMVVGVVSLKDFNSSPWRQLPLIVRQGTGVDVGAVVVTKLDGVQTDDLENLGLYKKNIRSIFWPAFPEEERLSRPVITCSALVGPAIDLLQNALPDLKSGTLPGWEFFGQPQYLQATRNMYGGKLSVAQRRMKGANLADLQSRMEPALEHFSFLGTPEDKGTFKKLLNVFAQVHQQSMLEYHGSLETLARGISFNLRSLMVLVGVAPGVGFVAGAGLERGVIKEQMDLLDAWNVQVHAFQEEVHDIVIRARGSLSSDMTSCVNKALISATQNLEHTHGSVPRLDIQNEDVKPLRFDNIEEIRGYMDSYRTAFDDLAKLLNLATAESVLKEANKTHDTLFGGMEDRLALPRLVSHVDLDNILPRMSASISEDALLQHVDEIRTRYTAAEAFLQVQIRLLKTAGSRSELGQPIQLRRKRNEFQERVQQMRALSRSLLVIASSIPFILTLPYWLQKSYVEAYTLSLRSLRPALLQEVASQSNKFLDLLENHITAAALKQTEAVIHSKFPSAPYHGSVTATCSEIQHLIAASADVIGLKVAAEEMQKQLLQTTSLDP